MYNYMNTLGGDINCRHRRRQSVGIHILKCFQYSFLCIWIHTRIRIRIRILRQYYDFWFYNYNHSLVHVLLYFNCLYKQRKLYGSKIFFLYFVCNIKKRKPDHIILDIYHSVILTKNLSCCIRGEVQATNIQLTITSVFKKVAKLNNWTEMKLQK